MADSNIACSGLTATSGSGQIIFEWQANDPTDFKSLPYMQIDKFEIWVAASNNRDVATKAGEAMNNAYVLAGLGPSVQRYGWVRARDRSGNYGDWFPASPTAGVPALTGTGLPNVDQLSDISDDLGSINAGTITGARIRTKASGARVEMQYADNSLKFYDRSGSQVGEISFDRSSSESVFWFDLSGGYSDGALFTNDSGVALYGRTSSTYAAINGESFNRNGQAGAFYNQANANSGGVQLGLGDSKGGWGLRTIKGTGIWSTRYEGGTMGLTGNIFTAGSVSAGLNVNVGNNLNVVGNANVSGTMTAGNYLPFTGAHEGLLVKDAEVKIGDIVSDKRVLVRYDISGVLSEVERSAGYGDKAVIGVLEHRAPLDDQLFFSPPQAIYRWMRGKFDYVRVNGVGEGQINVCGRGGDLAPGDFICTSDIPGKGQRMDMGSVATLDTLATIVARVRERVTFSRPDEIRLVSCTYHCG